MDNFHIREDTKYKPGTYQRNVKIYYPTSDMKTRCHILFEMLSSNLRSDLRDLKDLSYCDLKIRYNLSIKFSFHRSRGALVNRMIDSTCSVSPFCIGQENICARVDSIQSVTNGQ